MSSSCASRLPTCTSLSRYSSRPREVMPATHVPEVACVGQTNRGAAGVYELQLRRKLLQQQLGVVDERCQRVAKVVAKKHLARFSRQEKLGQPRVPGKDGVECRQKVITNPGGLPSMAVGGGSGRHEPEVRLPGRRPMTIDKTSSWGRASLQHKQDLLTATPFKKGGAIDHTRKKQMLQDKQREIERQAALEKRMRPGRKGLRVRDEVAAAPSAFPDRYLRGEVPCSKHCSAGMRVARTCPRRNCCLYVVLSGIHKFLHAGRHAAARVCTVKSEASEHDGFVLPDV